MRRRFALQHLWLRQFLVSFMLLVVGVSVSCLASDELRLPEFMLRSWNREDGLPPADVQAVARTPDGYLWVGTTRGLVRFDGVRFVTLTTNSSVGIVDNRITSLLSTRAGELWVGAEDGSLVRRRAGRFERVALETRGRRINALAEDASGNIWVGTRGAGVGRWRADNREFFTRTNGLPVDGAAQLAVDQSGRIWAVSGGRLVTFQAGRWQDAAEFSSVRLPVVAVARARDGGIWVGTVAEAGGLMGSRIFKIKDGMAVESTPYPWPQNTYHTKLRVLFEGSDGRLWAGLATEGIYYLEPGGGWHSLVPQETFSQLLVNCLMEDNSGNIWAGLDGAQLDQIQPRGVRTMHLPGSASQRVVRMTCAGSDGSIWVGTDGAGVFRYQNGNWTNYGSDSGLANGYVGVIFEDQRTNLWVGTWGGLFRLQGERFVPAWDPTGARPVVRAMCEDRNLNLWIGTTIGVIQASGSQAHVYSGAEGYTGAEVLAIAEDSTGFIWTAVVGGGLFRLDGERFQRASSDPWPDRAPISSLLADADGGLWIGTMDRGFAYTKDGVSAHWTTQDGLPSDTIMTMIEDQTGNLWFASDNGIIGCPKSRLHSYKRGVSPPLLFWQLSVADGLDSRRCSGAGQPVASRGADGRMWFPNSHALAVFNPDELPQSGAIFPPLLEEVLVDGQLVTPGENGMLRVSSVARGYEFHYSSPTPRLAERLRFRIRLAGWDNDWIEADQRRVAYYGHLSPGDYKFQVMAGSPAGLWQESPQELRLVVVPQWWERASLRIGGALLGAGLFGGTIWLVARARHRRNLAQLQLLHARESERQRIARDIHDSFGASLTRMALLGDMSVGPEQAQSHMGKVSVAAREMSQSLEAIVWAVRPENDTLRSLVEYLERRAEEFFDGTSVNCRFLAPTELPDRRVFAEARHNVFLACKEAMNNALKYASASEVRVELHCNDTQAKVTITDNGSGFDPAAARPDGTGLENMRTRMQAIGGRFELDTGPGRGTAIKLVFPVHPPATD